MNKTKYVDWYLSFDSLRKLSRREYNDIIEMYRSMLHAVDDSRANLAESYFNTLKNNGFIKNSIQEEREQKISELIDNENV